MEGFLQSTVCVCTIFLSAFLLFWIQPLFAKMVLPILGGSSAVWTSSMLFFQFTLLAGYLYAHCISRIAAIKWQVALHLALLTIAGLVLPFYKEYAEIDIPEGSPVLWLLSFAAVHVGPPFFMVSATAPMLQRWFSRTNHSLRDNPYFLYAASNLGSLAALLSFPILLEPFLGVRQQSLCWQTGYFLLLALFPAAALSILRGAEVVGDAPNTTVPGAPQAEHLTAGIRLAWVFSAFIPSSMMLGLTSHVTVDIAPVAMFWVVPFALYLLSFVIVFSRFQNLIGNKTLAAIIVFSASIILFMRFGGYDRSISTASFAVVANLLLFFASAWLFHGFLSSSKPPVAHLTEFYLWLSVGGVLGGFFNALIAPLIFNQVYEYYVVVFTVLFLALAVLVRKPHGARVSQAPPFAGMVTVFTCLLFVFLMVDMVMSRPISEALRRNYALITVICVVITGAFALFKPGKASRGVAIYTLIIGLAGNFLVWTQEHNNIFLARSFYGALKVKEKRDANDVPYHLFIHGSTRHNMQKFGGDLEENQEPLMYFHRQANIGHAVTAIEEWRDRPLHFGFVGLGAGAMSAYLRVGDSATFFELDPQVAAMAKNREYFTYVGEALGTVDILIGDARLQLKKAADASFDILLIDAFSSDAVPVHLLTAEALSLYLQKIKDDGVLLFHLSNRYLDLYKVLQGMRLPEGYVLYLASRQNVERPVEAAEGISGIFSHSQVALIAREAALPPEITASERWLQLGTDQGFRTWTDDYSQVLSVLRLF